MTKVIFRVWREPNHGVIALFPEHPADLTGRLCDAYEHIGQHGGASPHHVIQRSRPATAKEAAPLLRELVAIGYEEIQVLQRSSPAMDRARRAAATQMAKDFS